MEGSKPFSLTKEEILKVLKGLGYALAGAALVYIEQYLSSHDFGSYAPLAAALNSALIYLGNKFLSDTRAN